MEITLQEMAQKLREYPAYRIYYHKSPDGDAVMSAYALALALQGLGIPCEPICCDPLPEAYQWLVKDCSFPTLSSYTAIAVDSGSNKRLGAYSREPITLCIDHHENSMEAEFKYVIPKASSCSELIHSLLCEMKIPVTKKLADLLYTGLITDTQCFRTYSTNQGSLETAVALARAGADIVKLARRYALEKSPERLAIESILMSSFHYSCNNRILGCMFTCEDLLRINVDDSRLEGLNLVVDQVRGLDIGIVVRETRPGHCRVSVRTYTGLNAAEICRAFEGGGHDDRAGCEIESTPAEALRMVEERAASFLEQGSAPAGSLQ